MADVPFDSAWRTRIPPGWMQFPDGSIGPANKPSPFDSAWQTRLPPGSTPPLQPTAPTPALTPSPSVPGTGITSIPGGAVGGQADGMNMTLGPEPSVMPGQGSNIGTGKEVGPRTNPFTDAHINPNGQPEYLGGPGGVSGGGFNPFARLFGKGNPLVTALYSTLYPTPAETGELPPGQQPMAGRQPQTGPPRMVTGTPSNGPTPPIGGPAAGGGFNWPDSTKYPQYQPPTVWPDSTNYPQPGPGNPAASGAASPTVQPAPSSGPVATRAPAVPASAVNLGYYTGGNTPNSMGGARNPQWQQYQNPNDPRIFKGPLAQPAPSAPVSPAGATAPTGFQLPNNLDWASILKGMNYSGQQVT